MKCGKELSVGIAEIDTQHGELAAAVTSIEDAVRLGDRWISVHSAFVRTAECARAHFALEESLMRVLNYPDIEEHIAAHREFSNRLDVLLGQTLTAALTEESIVFIKGWLESHVLNHDLRYARYFAERIIEPGQPAPRALYSIAQGGDMPEPCA